MNSYDSDSSDEEFFVDLEERMAFVALLSVMPSTVRNFKWNNTRLNWVDHVEKLTHTKEFKQTYNMSLGAFEDFVDILRPNITMNVVNISNPICTS